MLRHNSDTGQIEFYRGTGWFNFLGSLDVAASSMSAMKLMTARTISLTGDVAGSVSFDGSANVSIPMSLSNSGVTAGTYTDATITVDATGRITAASSGASAAYTGATGQINVSSNVISLASDPTLPGNSGFIPPTGTTAQRPSAATAGQTRYNSDLGTLETFDGTDWLQPGAATGANGQFQYNNGGMVAGTPIFTVDSASALPMFPGQTGGYVPNYPNTAGTQLYGDSDAGANRLSMGWYNHSQWMNHHVQPSIATARHAAVYPWGGTGTTTPYTAVGTAVTTGGTITARNVTTISSQTNGQVARRFGLATAATVGTTAYLRQNNGAAQYVRGIGGGMGGWDYQCTFMVSAVAGTNGASTRWFVGMNTSTSTLPTTALSAWTNSVGFGADTGDTAVCLYYNSTNTTASKITLSNTSGDRSAKTTTDAYRVRIYSPPGGGFIGCSITNLSKLTAPYSTVLTTNIPSTSTFLQPWIWVYTNITTSSAIDLINWTIETDLA